MKAQLVIECFNHERDRSLRDFDRMLGGRGAPPRHWVAEILGESERFGFDRHFLSGDLDYSRANGAGSRGVRKRFILESGKLYEVKEQVSWRRDDRYFCIVTNGGDIVRMSDDEAATMAAHREIDDQAKQWRSGRNR